MAYQPFLVEGLKTAKSIGQKPFLIPKDGFSTLENWIVNKAVLEKRLGYAPFATMKHGAVVQTNTAVTGIHEYVRKGFPSLLIMDTARANYYNPVDQSMTDVSSDLTTPADIFSGSADDFFDFQNWQGVGYMTNNVDQIHKWEGVDSAVTPFNIQINTTDKKANHVDTCRFIFVKDDRLLLLDTVEFGDAIPNRLRYSPVLQTDFSASGSGNVDGPTQQKVVAAGFVGPHIAVFMQGGKNGSLWLIKSTGNADIPFVWKKVTETELVRSPYSGVEARVGVREGLVAIGTSNIIFYDGFQITNLDMPNARDILSEFNDAKIRSVFGYSEIVKERRHLLFTFASSGSSVTDRIVDFNLTENNWTVHKSQQSFFVNVIGGTSEQKIPIWTKADDVFGTDGDTMADADWDSREVGGDPSPITLIGCRNSQVYRWLSGEFDGTNDDNGKIEINANGAEWNPFKKLGKQVACEKIGFLVDNDENASFTVSMFKNTGTVAYKTKVISCDAPNDTVDMFWVWIFCDGEIGNFHRPEISHTEKGNTPKIHAYEIYLKSAGRLDA